MITKEQVDRAMAIANLEPGTPTPSAATFGMDTDEMFSVVRAALVDVVAELADQRAENTRLMSLVGEAMNPPTGDYRAEVIAAHLWLTQAGVPSAQTLAERVKLLVEQRNDARDRLRVCEEQFDALGEANEQNVRMEPLRTVLRSWDWAQLLDDERIPDEAVMPLLRAFAYVEAEENKAKENRNRE